MTIENDLLRMLEPVTRPDGLPGRSHAPPSQPFESRSFDSILDEARDLNAQPNAAAPTDSSASPDMIGQLSQIDRIVNPTLLNLIDRAERPNDFLPTEI